MMTGNYYDVAFGIILVAVLFFFGVRKIQKQNNISKEELELMLDISRYHSFMRNSGCFDDFEDRCMRREWSDDISSKEKLISDELLVDATSMNSDDILKKYKIKGL